MKFKNENHFSKLNKLFWLNRIYFQSHQTLKNMNNIFNKYFISKQTEHEQYANYFKFEDAYICLRKIKNIYI
jgi:hypothetical protein